MKHDNRIAVITGGSRGLGREIALHLAREGAGVILTYREKKTEGEEVLALIRGMGGKGALLQLDASRIEGFKPFEAAVKSVLEDTFGRTRFDFLVNNAGIDAHAAFADTTEGRFDALMNVHFKGVFFLTQTLLPSLADGGRIVNVSSGLARFSVPGYAAYASMKGAVEVLTRYLAKELGGRGITANVVAPGVTETDFTRQALERPGMRDFLSANIALGRIGQPGDIAGVVDFLCSPEGRWVTGQRVEASGGMFL